MNIKVLVKGSESVVADMIGAKQSGSDILVHTTPKGFSRLERSVSCPMAVTSQNLTTLWVRLFGCRLCE